MFLSPQLTLTGAGSGRRGGGGPGGAEAQAFLARTTGLDATHQNAYAALIDGLVADSIWPKLDVLHVYATQDSTTALLNLVSSSYNGTANGSPTFTTDRGFTGSQSSGTVYISTGFNPTTASSPKFVQDSAHVSAWSLTSGAVWNSVIGARLLLGSKTTMINPRDGDNKSKYCVNAAFADAIYVSDNVSAAAHFLVNRSGASAMEAYKNATSAGTNSSSSSAPPNLNFYTLTEASDGGFNGSSRQIAMASIGSSLSSGDVTAFYNRLRTYMTAVGVP